jgi:2-polyprenyl-3-methyl-5-hydroxy-6-metoxy-1,4-benzoquinol methylase
MEEHVCPVWVGRLLASPLRKLYQNPNKILRPYVQPGMTVLDVGCAMGFFSVPMAEMAAPDGRVFCVDMQEKMLQSLEKRAEKAGVSDRIDTRNCSPSGLGIEDLAGQIDFALAFAMVHEVPDAAKLLGELFAAVKPGGRLLISEPKGHVNDAAFEKTIASAEGIGFTVEDRPSIRGGISALLKKA